MGNVPKHRPATIQIRIKVAAFAADVLRSWHVDVARASLADTMRGIRVLPVVAASVGFNRPAHWSARTRRTRVRLFEVGTGGAAKRATLIVAGLVFCQLLAGDRWTCIDLNWAGHV